MPQKQLKLWVFTPDLLVSTSALETNEPVRVAKILWREEDARPDEEDFAERLNRQALSEGEIDLGEEEAELLAEMLRRSGEWMPKSSRRFGKWEVGLLERFSKADLESR